MRPVALLILTFGLGILHHARSEDHPSSDIIRAAIEKSLPLLESASRESAKQRKCFTCHNEGLPLLTFVEAQKRGFEIDQENIQQLLEHTAAHLKRGKSNYLKGTGQGGKADTAGSALWALEAGGYQRNEVTDAVVHFLLKWNEKTPFWEAQSKRPPSEGSRYTSTFLALRGLAAYEFDEKLEAIEARRGAARDWILKAEPTTTEDLVFRLRTLDLINAGKEQTLADAAKPLLELQRDDGGWAQLADLESDAYATGSALAALGESKQLDTDSANYWRGLNFLIDSQQPDGSWHVISRSRPIQEFYESGFPHDEDQFISCSGTAWATLALLRALPIDTATVSKPVAAP